MKIYPLIARARVFPLFLSRLVWHRGALEAWEGRKSHVRIGALSEIPLFAA